MTLDGRVHAAVLRSFVERGHAPGTSELAASLGVEPTEIATALRSLHDGHGLVLHPGSTAVWIAHPFSASSTNVCVTAGDRTWWAPCLWCASGVISLLGERGGEAVVHARWQGEHEPLVLTADASSDPLVHFALPPRDAWDNVVHWCASVQPFRAAADIDGWCERHRMPRGEAVPWSHVLALGRAWYGGHLSPTWRKWTAREAVMIFGSVGLRSAFWALPDSDERF